MILDKLLSAELAFDLGENLLNLHLTFFEKLLDLA